MFTKKASFISHKKEEFGSIIIISRCLYCVRREPTYVKDI